MGIGERQPSRAALRINGLAAPFVLDGPMDGNAFRAYINPSISKFFFGIDGVGRE
jgi:hypothetical protein